MVTFFPMNPKEVKKNPKKLEELLNHPRWCLQLKKDGVRGELHVNPDGNGKNRIFGRKAGVKDPTRPLEMTHNLPTIANWKFPKSFHGNVYDVEIYHPELTSSQIAGFVNPNRVDEPWEREPEIQFWCFDLPVLKSKLNGYLQWQRIQLYEALFKPYRKQKHRLHTLWFVETFYDDKARRVQEWLDSGEEGGVLKNLDKEYLFSFEVEGKRAADYWVKYKRGFEDDFILVGFEAAEKYYDGKEHDTWKYWEHEDGSKLELNPNDPNYFGTIEQYELKPVTKFYFNDWIGSVHYGSLIDVKDLERHCKRYNVTFEQRKWSNHDKTRVLIKLGKTSGISDELRAKISKAPEEYLHQVIKISGMEQYKDTLAVRHPALQEIRWDKSASECRIEFD